MSICAPPSLRTLISAPPFVGTDCHCESANTGPSTDTWHLDTPLWDGKRINVLREVTIVMEQTDHGLSYIKS